MFLQNFRLDSTSFFEFKLEISLNFLLSLYVSNMLMLWCIYYYHKESYPMLMVWGPRVAQLLSFKMYSWKHWITSKQIPGRGVLLLILIMLRIWAMWPSRLVTYGSLHKTKEREIENYVYNKMHTGFWGTVVLLSMHHSCLQIPNFKTMSFSFIQFIEW